MWYCEGNITSKVWVQLGTRKQLWPALKIPIEKLICAQQLFVIWIANFTDDKSGFVTIRKRTELFEMICQGWIKFGLLLLCTTACTTV